jgi:hypothetical protein
VVAMAVTMYLAGDPDGSLIMVLASVAAAATLVGLACFLYRPLLSPPSAGRPPAAGGGRTARGGPGSRPPRAVRCR